MADNMLIDGLIKFCDEKSKNIKLKAEPQVFIEIKQALEELKAIKSDKFSEYLLNMGYTKGITDGYNKAIDEFAERLKKKVAEELSLQIFIDEDDLLDKDQIDKYIDEITEEMKAGGKNE